MYYQSYNKKIPQQGGVSQISLEADVWLCKSIGNLYESSLSFLCCGELDTLGPQRLLLAASASIRS